MLAGALGHEKKSTSRPLTNGSPELQVSAAEASPLPKDADVASAEQAEAQDGISPLASLLGYRYRISYPASGEVASMSSAGKASKEGASCNTSNESIHAARCTV